MYDKLIEEAKKNGAETGRAVARFKTLRGRNLHTIESAATAWVNRLPLNDIVVEDALRNAFIDAAMATFNTEES